MILQFKFLLCGICALISAIPGTTGVFNFNKNALKVYGHAYYNPVTGEAISGEIEESERIPSRLTKIIFRNVPCLCEAMSCVCCAGINITSIKLDRRACAKFTAVPERFSIDLDVMMNEKEVFVTTFSASNPPPFCIPLPYIPVLSFCLRFYDLYMRDNNLHACVDFETRVTHSPVLILHFNCVHLGQDGVVWLKPGEDIPDGTNNIADVIQGFDVFDPVDFESEDVLAYNDTLTQGQPDNIGSWKVKTAS